MEKKITSPINMSIFGLLVKDESDLIGHIAYSLYKRDKIEWIRIKNYRTGHLPTKIELEEYRKIRCNPEYIEQYRERAQILIQEFFLEPIDKNTIATKRKVFISYSWDNEEHMKWVDNLAEDLENNYNKGIHVTFDKKTLRLGDDLSTFMKKGISEADKVICIMTQEYKNAYSGDSRSPIPMISVHSVGDFLYRRQS